MRIILTVIATCLLAAGAGSGHAAARDAKELVRDLRAVTHRETKGLPYNEVDYSRLVALLPQALELARKPGALWQQIPSDDFPNSPGIRLFDVLQDSLRAAAGSAPSEAEKERWLRQELELVKRMLQDRRTQRVYAEKRDEQKSASDYNYVVAVRSRVLEGVKELLKRFRFLRPEEWTVLQGVTVVDEPGTVVIRNGRPFIAPGALAVLGLPASAGGQPVSVDELTRRGLAHVEVRENSQIIELRPVPMGPRRLN